RPACGAWAGRGGACAADCGAHSVGAHARITMPRHREPLHECISGILIAARRRAILLDLTHLNYAVQPPARTRHPPSENVRPTRAAGVDVSGGQREVRERLSGVRRLTHDQHRLGAVPGPRGGDQSARKRAGGPTLGRAGTRTGTSRPTCTPPTATRTSGSASTRRKPPWRPSPASWRRRSSSRLPTSLPLAFQNTHDRDYGVPIPCRRRHAQQFVELAKVADRFHVPTVHTEDESVFRCDDSQQPLPTWRKGDGNGSPDAAGFRPEAHESNN